MHSGPLSYDIVYLASDISKNRTATILLENIYGNKYIIKKMKLNQFLLIGIIFPYLRNVFFSFFPHAIVWKKPILTIYYEAAFFIGGLLLGILSDFEDECHTWESSLFALCPRPVFKIQIATERFGALSVHILRQNGKEIYTQLCPVSKAILSYGSAY